MLVLVVLYVLAPVIRCVFSLFCCVIFFMKSSILKNILVVVLQGAVELRIGKSRVVFMHRFYKSVNSVIIVLTFFSVLFAAPVRGEY